MHLIVAVDKNWAIGKDGDQLIYIPEDLKHFKALTTGHPVILGRKTLAAHCIHLNWEDVQILRETDTAVIHCPRSNMCNAAGAADVTEYSRARVGLGLGTDGEAADMLGELAAASALCRHSSQNPDAGFEELPRALFTSNAAFANRFFETPLGVLKPGAAGDVIVLCGKGHETYQEIGTIKYHLDEREVVRERFAQVQRKDAADAAKENAHEDHHCLHTELRGLRDHGKISGP